MCMLAARHGLQCDTATAKEGAQTGPAGTKTLLAAGHCSMPRP